jgi:hypothetical protein
VGAALRRNLKTQAETMPSIHFSASECGAIDHGARNTGTAHEDIKIDDDASLTRMITEANIVN